MTPTTLTTSVVPTYTPTLLPGGELPTTYPHSTSEVTVSAVPSATTTTATPTTSASPQSNGDCDLAHWHCAGVNCYCLHSDGQTVIPTVTPTQPGPKDPKAAEKTALSPRSSNTAVVAEHLPATATTTDESLVTRAAKILPGHRRPFNNIICGECKRNEKGEREQQCQTCRMWPPPRRQCFEPFTRPCEPETSKPSHGQ